MGMFDYVVHREPCPQCGTMLYDWQSKDLECNLDYVLPHKVQEMYTTCENCGLWVRYWDGVRVSPPTFGPEPDHLHVNNLRDTFEAKVEKFMGQLRRGKV